MEKYAKSVSPRVVAPPIDRAETINVLNVLKIGMRPQPYHVSCIRVDLARLVLALLDCSLQPCTSVASRHGAKPRPIARVLLQVFLAYSTRAKVFGIKLFSTKSRNFWIVIN